MPARDTQNVTSSREKFDLRDGMCAVIRALVVSKNTRARFDYRVIIPSARRPHARGFENAFKGRAGKTSLTEFF